MASVFKHWTERRQSHMRGRADMVVAGDAAMMFVYSGASSVLVPTVPFPSPGDVEQAS